MKVSIIPPDHVMVVDGVAVHMPIDLPGVHAIQWQDGAGRTEYLDGTAEEFEGNAPIQALLPEYWAARKRIEEETAKAQEEARKVLTPLAFLRRFTPAERISMQSSGDPVVGDGLLMMQVAQDVRLNDPDTVAFVHYAAQRGYITAGRVAEILGASGPGA